MPMSGLRLDKCVRKSFCLWIGPTRRSATIRAPGGLLRLARDLYGRAPEALVFSIGAADFDFRPTLSSKVRRAMPGMLRSVEDAVRRIGQDMERCHA